MYYQESGKIDIGRTVFVSAIVLALIVLASYLYIAINTFVPFIYLNVIIAAGYGLLLGIFVRLIAHVGKFRSTTTALVLAAVLGLAATYTQWMAFVTYVFSDFSNAPLPYLLNLIEVNPLDLWAAMSDINQFGTWGIGASPDTNISGIMLTGVWIAEAAMILGLPIYQAYQRKVIPFSEAQDRFYESHTLSSRFAAVYSAPNAAAALRQDPVAYLESIADFSGYPCSEITVYTLPNESMAYLDIEKVSLDDKSNERKVTIIDNLALPIAEARRILETYGQKAGSAEASSPLI